MNVRANCTSFRPTALAESTSVTDRRTDHATVISVAIAGTAHAFSDAA